MGIIRKQTLKNNNNIVKYYDDYVLVKDKDLDIARSYQMRVNHKDFNGNNIYSLKCRETNKNIIFSSDLEEIKKLLVIGDIVIKSLSREEKEKISVAILFNNIITRGRKIYLLERLEVLEKENTDALSNRTDLENREIDLF